MRTQFKSVFILVLLALILPIPLSATVIFQDNFDNCTSGYIPGSTPPTGWSQWFGNGSSGISQNVGGVIHYSGEFSAPGRGGTGASFKQWRNGAYWEDYAGTLIKFFSGGYQNIYVRYYIKLPTALNLGSATEYWKWFRLNGSGGGEIYVNINPGSRSTGALQVGFSGGMVTVLNNEDLKSLLWDGNWHCLEFRFDISSARTVQFWLDGIPKFTSTNFNFGALQGQTFSFLQHFPTGNHGSLGTFQSGWQALEVDDLVIADSYVGPAVGSGTTVNGVCGSANNQSFTSITSESPNLCSSGTVVSFSGSGPWSWGCNGSGGGSSTSSTECSALLATTPVNGVCGSANNQSFTSITSESPNLCSSGTVASFSGSGPWSWGCNGSSGGSSTSSTACSASLATATVSSSTTLFSESFENNSYAARGWYDNTNHGTIVSGGVSGNCLQWAWAQGAAAPTNGGSMRMQFTPTDSLYISYYVKFQSGWRGSQQAYHPHMIYILSDLDNNANAYSGLANNYLNTYVEFVSDVGSPYTIRPLLAIQDEKRVNTSNGTPPNNLTAVTENRSVAYCNTPVSSGATGACYADAPYYSANAWKASSASVSTNSWHHVEVYLKMNTISGGKGQSDGIMQEWIDGIQVINQSNVLYRTNQDATKKWAQLVLAPWIGDGSPIAESMWIDEMRVATASSSSTPATAPSVTIKSVSPN